MPSRALAEFSSSLSFDHIPTEVVDLTKRLLLDSLGCALAASTIGDACPQTIQAMSELGGPGQSTILGTRTKVSAPFAAFANGGLVHALNYDAIGRTSAGRNIGHIGVVCLVAPL